MRILVVDDHPLVRKGISSILSFEKEVEDIKEASNVEEALHILSEYNPAVTIIDLRLGREDGLEIVSRAKKSNCATKFIVLTSSINKDDFLRAQQEGVDGYILKGAYTEDIIYAFHVIARGRKYFDPEIMQFKPDNSGEKLDELTERETDVLMELGKGLSNIQIAQKLFISEYTVKKHISSILSKLNLKHRIEAALLVNNHIKTGQ